MYTLAEEIQGAAARAPISEAGKSQNRTATRQQSATLVQGSFGQVAITTGLTLPKGGCLM